MLNHMQQQGLEFESNILNYFEERDVAAFETPQTNDYGADIIVYYGGKVFVIQCKYHSSPVGISAVQELVAAIPFYKADAGIVISNQSYTKQARRLAEANDVVLVDGRALKEMLDDVSGEVSLLDTLVKKHMSAEQVVSTAPPRKSVFEHVFGPLFAAWKV